ncbi:hypothetical protein RM572_06350 [Streptomyces sp. DSM 42041]|uniref:ATP-binding protein n=1 Tax=Streptomyces hazeniae TaxID=3075538 RepID=A0ABU2NN43_9ACTN|nr:hypothetical protein [Streptomyces sp. DSM 42041]MDT0378401.1 hypothetical protein [Streptomyces sp. DSM 42041]
MKQLASVTVPSAARRAITHSVPGQLDMRISLSPAAVHTVRRVVADHLRLWDAGLDDLPERTLRAVTALLTAALPPGPDARQDVHLLVQRVPGGLCVNVRHCPATAPATARLMAALGAIADDSGVSAESSGVDTWATILHRAPGEDQ